MAARYELLDSDEYRLPEGMQRVGYDADTQTYTFRDTNDGSLWESEPGSRYGRLHHAGTQPSRSEEDFEDAMLRQAKKQDWRYMAPFFLVILAILLLVWRFFGPSVSFSSGTNCAGGTEPYSVEQGDTCWDIAERAGVSVNELRQANEGLDCERLRVDGWVCVPVGRE